MHAAMRAAICPMAPRAKKIHVFIISWKGNVAASSVHPLETRGKVLTFFPSKVPQLPLPHQLRLGGAKVCTTSHTPRGFVELPCPFLLTNVGVPIITSGESDLRRQEHFRRFYFIFSSFTHEDAGIIYEDNPLEYI